MVPDFHEAYISSTNLHYLRKLFIYCPNFGNFYCLSIYQVGQNRWSEYTLIFISKLHSDINFKRNFKWQRFELNFKFTRVWCTNTKLLIEVTIEWSIACTHIKFVSVQSLTITYQLTSSLVAGKFHLTLIIRYIQILKVIKYDKKHFTRKMQFLELRF